MKSNLREHWPLAAAVVLLVGSVAVLVGSVTSACDGHLVFPLDDPYIHLAMGKNLARHGAWGITPYGFTSSTSSPLWTAILGAAFLLTGPNAWVPLALNLAAAAAVLYAADRWLRLEGAAAGLRFLVLAAILLAAPLPALTVTAMEHTLHVLLVVAFVTAAARALAQPAEEGDPRLDGALRLLAALVVLARYESLFLVAGICLLFLLQRKVRPAVLVGAYALLPVLVYGVISQAMGWDLLPNSVLMKGTPLDVWSVDDLARLLWLDFFNDLANAPLILVLVTTALVIAAAGRGEERERSLALLVIPAFGVAVLAHVLVARVAAQVIDASTLTRSTPDALRAMSLAITAGNYRYDAYLIVLGLMLTLPGLARRLRAAPAEGGGRAWPVLVGLLGAVVLGSPLAHRAYFALAGVPPACRNVYEQQYQMGRFLARYYRGAPVAVNDIGAVNYLADIHCVDLWGLSTMEVARLKLKGRYTQADIARITQQQGVRVAILFEPWFLSRGRSALPPYWVKLGEWRVSREIVSGYHTVSFFAADPAEAPALAAHLREFSSQLPGTVRQSGAYRMPEDALPGSERLQPFAGEETAGPLENRHAGPRSRP